jgi:hypothetical protein
MLTARSSFVNHVAENSLFFSFLCFFFVRAQLKFVKFVCAMIECHVYLCLRVHTSTSHDTQLSLTATRRHSAFRAQCTNTIINTTATDTPTSTTFSSSTSGPIVMTSGQSVTVEASPSLSTHEVSISSTSNVSFSASVGPLRLSGGSDVRLDLGVLRGADALRCVSCRPTIYSLLLVSCRLASRNICTLTRFLVERISRPCSALIIGARVDNCSFSWLRAREYCTRGVVVRIPHVRTCSPCHVSIQPTMFCVHPTRLVVLCSCQMYMVLHSCDVDRS